MPRTDGDSVVQGGCGRLRAFAPLFLWCCLAALLVGWDLYRRITNGTSLTFRILVEGREPTRELDARIDGHIFKSGERIRFGKRTLSIAAPGLEPYERILSVRFGAQNLGNIDLKRSRGALAIITDPKPRTIHVSGPDLNATTNDANVKFDRLLIGNYKVRADFGLFTEDRQVEVKRNEEARAEFKPAVGALTLTAPFTNVNFRLTGTNKVRVEGSIPKRIENVPVGEYALGVRRGDYVQESRVEVRPGDSNRVEIEFPYSTVKFETVPTGARVSDQYREMGVTPLTLTELLPGTHKFRLSMNGYASVPIVVDTGTNTTHTITTNLVNERYAAAIERARRSAEGNFADFNAALASVEDALRMSPNDSAALELKAKVESAVKDRDARIAEQRRTTEVTIAARQQEAFQKLAQQRQATEQMTKKQFPAEAFRKATESEKDAMLFDTHRWTIQSDAMKVADALRRMVQQQEAGWKIVSDTKVNEETFQFRCDGVTKLLSTSRRYAIVVIGQTETNAVEIHAKFWEYQSTKVGLSLTQGLTKDGLVPMHPHYFRAADRGTVEAKRKSLPEDFKTKLFNELK